MLRGWSSLVWCADFKSVEVEIPSGSIPPSTRYTQRTTDKMFKTINWGSCIYFRGILASTNWKNWSRSGTIDFMPLRKQ